MRPNISRENPNNEQVSNLNREVYAYYGNTDKNGEINLGTAMLALSANKLMWYFGYKELREIGEMVEVYDLSVDPEELGNLYPKQKIIADELFGRLRSKITKVEAFENQVD